MIFQHFNLLAAKTVEDNVALPLKIASVPRRQRLQRAAELLALVGLSEKAKAYPASLSGGQKQRVGIARALAARPAILLSDEATSALDPETTRSILALLRDINRKLELTVIAITHEMEVVRSIADRVAVIDAGRIIEEGPVWQVFANPEFDITRSLLGGIRPTLPPEIAVRLSATNAGETVLRADVAGPVAGGTLLSDLAVAVPGAFRLIHGGVDHIQGQAVAAFFLGLPTGATDQVAQTVQFLEARNVVVEVLGHVAGDG
jgi:D-methionine transport system ATP-binding protein